MDGDIRVMSEEGRGSIFEFDVQLTRAKDARNVLPPVSINNRNILVLDDNQTTLDVMRSQLSHWQANVFPVRTDEKAIHTLEQFDQKPETIDLVLIDLQLPPEQKQTFCEALKHRDALGKIKLVGMSTMTAIAADGSTDDTRIDRIFPKPATTEDLFNAFTVLDESPADEPENRSGISRENSKQTSESEDTHQYRWPDKTRILIVDDNQINQLVATGILENLGLAAECASDGQEALQQLKTAPADAPYTLVLMDCQMPVLDGYETTAEIRQGNAGKIYEALPIIAMTANAMEGDKERCITAGMDDYLPKPIEPGAVKEKLIQWLKPVAKTEETKKAAPKAEKNQPDAWNRADALSRLGGDESMITTVLEMYLKDNEERMDQLREASREQDYADVIEIIHTLKGVAGNLGAATTVFAAIAVERAIKAERYEDVSALIDKLIEEESRLSDRFREELNKTSNLSAM
jgi:CheY-like chemotaxis protein